MIMTWPIHHVPSVLREGWVMEGVTFSHKSKAVSHWHEKQLMWDAVGSPMRLHAHSNTKMHSKVCVMIQKSIRKHFGWAFRLLSSQRKVPQVGSFFSQWKCFFDHWIGCQNMPKWVKTITYHTSNLKLECLSHVMLSCHICHDERNLGSIVFSRAYVFSVFEGRCGAMS